MSWPAEVAEYFTSGFLWAGAVLAIQITAASMTIGLTLGLVLALMRMSEFRVVSSLAWSYIWLMRGTPLLLQLVFIFDALPLIGLKFGSFSTAVIGFSLNQAAFAAEIIRGGILSVNPQQAIAASSLGMGPLLTLRRIVLPQAMRAILPALANDTIGMLKMTSVASVIFVNELTFRSQQIVGQNFKFFTVFAGAALIYLLLTSLISGVQMLLERRLDPEIRVKTGGRGLLFWSSTQPEPVSGLAPIAISIPVSRVEAVRELIPAVREIQTEQSSSFLSCQCVESLWRSRRIAGGKLGRAARRGGRSHRAERLGQEHATASHQPSRIRRSG